MTPLSGSFCGRAIPRPGSVTLPGRPAFPWGQAATTSRANRGCFTLSCNVPWGPILRTGSSSALSRMIVLRSGQPLDPRPGGDGRRLCGKHLPGRVGIFLSESAVRYLCPAGPVRRGLSFHRKNPLVFPSRTAYYRESFFAMTEFIRKFQACGQLRTTEDPELTTALILEPLSRWAMDVRWRPLRPGTSRRSGPRRYVWTTCRTPTPGVDRSPVPPCFCETERRTSPLWCRPPEGLPQALPETQQRPYLPENGAGYR